MDENFEQNQDQTPQQETKEEKRDAKEPSGWSKCLLITLAVFLGVFFAVYFVVDNMIHRFFMPPIPPQVIGVDDLDDILREQDRMMQDFAKYKPLVNPFSVNPVKVQTFQKDDEYIIMVDLKPFGGDEKNIKVDVKPNSVKLSGESSKKDKHSENDISFSQSFSLPHKVDVEDVTKEKKGNNYVITIPIED